MTALNRIELRVGQTLCGVCFLHFLQYVFLVFGMFTSAHVLLR